MIVSRVSRMIENFIILKTIHKKYRVLKNDLTKKKKKNYIVRKKEDFKISIFED